MKILVAFNAFKSTLSALEASSLLEYALQNEFNLNIAPIADGGDGTAKVIAININLKEFVLESFDALGRPITARYYSDSHKTAYLDLADCSGISQLDPKELEIYSTSTFGTGLVIKKAFEAGHENIVLGLGGSASIDLGLGLLNALGLRIFDINGENMSTLDKEWIKNIDRFSWDDNPYGHINFTLLCDVNNKFWGKEGAILTFGKQKGLRETEKDKFTYYIKSLYRKLQSANPQLKDKSYHGAAGGVAVGLSTFFNSEIHQGSSYVYHICNLDQKIRESDVIITGEGRYDSQSKWGKACHMILQKAKKYGKKTILLSSGTIRNNDLVNHFVQLDDVRLGIDSRSEIIEKFKKAAIRVKTILEYIEKE